jgi:hypothetical protein
VGDQEPDIIFGAYRGASCLIQSFLFVTFNRIYSALCNTNISPLFLWIVLDLKLGADKDKVSEDRDKEVDCNLAQDATDPS